MVFEFIAIMIASALCVYLMSFVIIGFGYPAIAGVVKAFRDKELSWWMRLMLLFQSALWGCASIFFLIAPVVNYGWAAVAGYALAAVGYFLVFMRYG